MLLELSSFSFMLLFNRIHVVIAIIVVRYCLEALRPEIFEGLRQFLDLMSSISLNLTGVSMLQTYKYTDGFLEDPEDLKISMRSTLKK